MTSATFIRVLEAKVDEKAGELLRAVAELREGVGPAAFDTTSGQRSVFECDPTALGGVPGSPFAYWVSDGVRSIFAAFTPMEGNGRSAIFGASTKDDRRYLRMWTEVSAGLQKSRRADCLSEGWVLLAKGGSFSPYYADIYLAVKWHADGKEVKADISEYRGSRGWGYQWTASLNGHSHFFRPA